MILEVFSNLNGSMTRNQTGITVQHYTASKFLVLRKACIQAGTFMELSLSLGYGPEKHSYHPELVI